MMSTQTSGQFHIQNNQGRLEVVGITQEQLEYALSLAQAIDNERMDLREALSSRINEIMLQAGITPVSHASQRQIQRSAALRRHLIDDEGAETYASLAERQGKQESSVRTWVSRARKSHELFTVEVQGQTLIPGVLLTVEGKIDHAIAEMIRPLLTDDIGGWSLWAWLTSPTGLLSGDTPAEVARGNIERACTAAERYGDEIRLARSNTS